MAVESIALGSQVQASVQALKLALEQEAAAASLVQTAVQAGNSAQLASDAPAPATDPNRLLDIIA